jgi:predicted small lipoprotein YifL
MIKIMKRNFRSLAFLLLITVAATGLSGALSFAAPTAGQANDNKARTRSAPRTGGSATKAPAGCQKRCESDYDICLSATSGDGPGPWQCKKARDKCVLECKQQQTDPKSKTTGQRRVPN